MAKVNAQEYADKWGRRLKGATQDISRGIDKVTEAPGKKAAEAQQLMMMRLIESIENGTWARQVAGVSLEDWKKATKDKGIPRISAGVDGAMNKQVDMAERLLVAVDRAAAAARALPKGTIEDSINRMATFARQMHDSKIK